MKRSLIFALVWGAQALFALPAIAQSDPDPAMNNPDELAWQLFIQVNSRAGGSNSVFETFASDTDTFQPNPQYPSGPQVSALHAPVLLTAARRAAAAEGAVLPAIPPDPASTNGEESRRNRAAFDFIVQNNLYKVSGLKAAFGKTLSFPIDAIEVKANWKQVDLIPAWTHNQVTLAQVPQLYHVNTASDHKQYALVSMHVISKQVPNWTWATFEHRYNPGRCDIIGCRDSFGAQTPVVSPLRPPTGAIYPDCVKSPALSALLSQADIDPVYANYCLKGSQTDFIDNTGLDVRVGNSVTEAGFVPTASCMTCHSRAAFDKDGGDTLSPGGAGFVDPAAGIAPLGPTQPAWYWSTTASPPIFQGMKGLTRIGTSADFVWSIPFCAIDDSTDPPQPSGCTGK
jgi:hypothetical protein